MSPVAAPRALALRLAAAALLLFSGCAKRPAQTEGAAAPGVLDRALDADVEDLDPHIVTGLAEGAVLNALFEPLARIDPETLRPVPALAERWEVSADGLTYTFHLRADARWSNGDPLTAADVRESWRRVLTPTLGAPYAYQFFCIRGAQEFLKGATTDFGTVGVAASDDRTLEVRLARPTTFFLGLVTQPLWAPVHLRSIAASGDPYRRGNPWTRPGRLVSNGPFRLAEWMPNQRLTVEKSPAFHGAAGVKLKAIHFHPIDNADAQERAFRTGQLHVTESVPVTRLPSYRRERPEVVRSDPLLDTYFIRFNVRSGPLRDPRVRRALSLAIDRESITTNVLKAGQKPASSFVPPGLPDYVPAEGARHDVAEARRLLAEAGYPGGKGLPPLELLNSYSNFLPLLSEALQAMWRQQLGIEVRLRRQDQKVIYADRRAGNYEMLLFDWIGDYFDPTTFLDLWRSDSGNNHTGWGNGEYDRLLDEAGRTLDRTARAALLRQAEDLVLREAPIAPVLFNAHVYLLDPKVKDWRPTPLNTVDYQRVWLQE